MERNPRSTAQIGGHPIHPMLVAIPAAFLVAAPVCGVAFWVTRDPVWSIASIWLIGVALAFGAIAAVAGLVDFGGDPRIRALREAKRHMVGNLVLLSLTLLNWGGRYAFGNKAVLPRGLAISALVFLILFYTGWNGWQMVYRHRVGVAER
ncbi:MAG: DUF2231 domain-containing protein [Xanthobacteraceae bacterium]